MLPLLSGACFLIGSNNALVCWRWGPCSMETPQAIVPPKWIRTGWGGSCEGCCLSWSCHCGQNWCLRHSGLAPPFCLPCDLTELEERVECEGPEAGFEPWGVEMIWGGSLAVEAESCTDQTVVAAALVAAGVVKTWAVAYRRAWLPRWTAGDVCRACSASRHPGQDHINDCP